jgi:hypothetical protein
MKQGTDTYASVGTATSIFAERKLSLGKSTICWDASKKKFTVTGSYSDQARCYIILHVYVENH